MTAPQLSEPHPHGQAERDRPCIQLGLIITPTLDPSRARRLGDEVREALSAFYADTSWQLALLRDRLVDPPVHLTELVDATRDRLLEEGWDLAVNVTDLPLRLEGRPLLTHASPTHGVALVSLPAHGVLHRTARLREAVVDAVAALVGDSGRGSEQNGAGRRRLRARRRLVELATDLDDDPDAQGVFFTAKVVGGNFRLLLGMVGANHPFRLVRHLYRALGGALAAATFALMTSDVWRVADRLTAPRLALVGLVACATAVAGLIAAHRLWERPRSPHVREQVVLFNVATFVTVALGVAYLYLAVFAAALAGAVVLIESSLFGAVLGHSVAAPDYLRLAWLVSSLATVGGALGAVLESDAAVREAAYASLPEEQADVEAA
jgi:hypothetical protein